MPLVFAARLQSLSDVIQIAPLFPLPPSFPSLPMHDCLHTCHRAIQACSHLAISIHPPQSSFFGEGEGVRGGTGDGVGGGGGDGEGVSFW